MADDDFVREEDEMIDVQEAAPPVRLRSTVGAVRKQKGRGFREDGDADEDRYGEYEQLDSGRGGPGPAKCKLLPLLRCSALIRLIARLQVLHSYQLPVRLLYAPCSLLFFLLFFCACTASDSADAVYLYRT
jgi:hypothetical protein